LPETRVRGSRLQNHVFIGVESWLSSTTRWGCGYVYDGTASGSLDQRFYASTYGRFNTPDPSINSNALRLTGNWNKYAYVGGDPVNKTDPRGLCSPQDDPPCYSTTVYGSGGDGGSGGGGYAPPQGPQRNDPPPLTVAQERSLIHELQGMVKTGNESDCDALAEYVDDGVLRAGGCLKRPPAN
jgi:RHS repeat-associated protein